MDAKPAGISLKDACAQAGARIAAMPVKEKIVTCPLCGEQFLGFGDLTAHYLAAHPGSIAPTEVRMTVNGKFCQLIIEPQMTLREVLQLKLGLTGAKQMCDRGQCGSCTVIMDGKPTLSCSVLAADCEGKTVETVEGIAVDPKWQPLIDAYCRWDAMQCGYCTPGFLVAAKALLDVNPHPTEQEIKEALSGNICICGTYPRHSQAILEAAEIIGKGAN